MTNTMKRSDPHSPSQFVPGHYRYVTVLDLYAGGSKDDVAALAVDTTVPWAWRNHVQETTRKIEAFKVRTIGDRPALSQCSICGHHIRYAVVWEYAPEGTVLGLVTSGLDCAENVDAANVSELRDKVGALQQFVAGQRKAVRDAEQAHREAPVRTAASEEEDSWIAADPSHGEVAAFLDSHARMHEDMPEDCPLCSMAMQLSERGRLSVKQVAYARDLASRSAALPPEGDGIEVIGTVRATRKEHSGHVAVDVPEGRDGLRRVRPFRVWLPVRRPVPPGTTVRFVATLHASRSDASFLIASNVTGQAILEHQMQ